MKTIGLVDERIVRDNLIDLKNIYALPLYINGRQYENDELKGKLKEIAAELDDESNPVVMLIKYKK